MRPVLWSRTGGGGAASISATAVRIPSEEFPPRILARYVPSLFAMKWGVSVLASTRLGVMSVSLPAGGWNVNDQVNGRGFRFTSQSAATMTSSQLPVSCTAVTATTCAPGLVGSRSGAAVAVTDKVCGVQC
jgi:hypothetical protein